MLPRISLSCLLLLATAGPALAGGDVFATTTTYEVVGQTARMSIDSPWNAALGEYTIHSDAVVRDYADRWVFIVNRLLADNVLVLDRDSGYGVVTQYSVAGTGLNPRDIHVEPSAGPGSAPGRAFIPLYESNSLLVCDALSGANAVTIDLSGFADADGLCEMDQLCEVEGLAGHPEGLLFVVIQNQDRSGSWWVPTDEARLAVIDVATESLVDADPVAAGINGIDLELKNPAWRIVPAYVRGSWKVLVNCTGDYGVEDGGIEMVDPVSLTSEGVYFSEAALGGDVLDFAVLGPKTGWAIRSTPSYQTELVRFDPQEGTVTLVAHTSAGFDLADIELSKDLRLFVADRDATQPGIRIYDAVSGVLETGPRDTGLPPFDLTLLDELATAAPVARLAPRLLAEPNPFNPRVEIRWVASAADAPAVLEILDLRGRRITRLHSRNGVWTWDGTSDDGASVASGAYVAQPVGVEAAGVKLMLVR
jgi:hypothetical protein